MEPRNKHMGLYPAGKGEKTDRDVCDPLVEVIPSLRVYRIRHLAHQAKDDGYVMWGEGPQDVLFAANFPQIEAVRIDVSDPAELTPLHQLFLLKHGGGGPQPKPPH